MTKLEMAFRRYNGARAVIDGPAARNHREDNARIAAASDALEREVKIMSRLRSADVEGVRTKAAILLQRTEGDRGKSADAFELAQANLIRSILDDLAALTAKALPQSAAA